MVKRMCLFFAVLIVLMPSVALAEDYTVTASVPASLPASLPEIETPGNNSVQQLSNVFVSGACEVVTPALIVVLVRNDEVIGSGPCTEQGTFRILVGLVLGANVIYPRFVSITGQLSGFGTPIRLMYEPVKITNTPSGGGTAEQGKPLTIEFDYDFVTYTPEEPLTVTYSIFGGSVPYEVLVAWGDGTELKEQIPAQQTITNTHTYAAVLPPASITILATDNTGAKNLQSRALVSFRQGMYVPPAQPIADKSVFRYQLWLGMAVLAGILFYVFHARSEALGTYRKKHAPKKVAPKVTKKKKK